MASTGTAVFTMNRDQMITSALRALRVLQEGQAANAQQIADAAPILNMIIKKMQSDGLMLWTYQLIQIPMVADKYFYTLGPSGADVTVNRPLRLYDGAYIRDTSCPDQPFDTPLRVISRLDYLQFGSKLSQGVPNSIYYDAQFNVASNLTSSAYGWGTVYVYTNVAADITKVIYGNFQRQLYDMNSASDEFDFPSEGFMALRWSLAEQLADDYEVPEQRLMRVMSNAKRYRDDLEDWSTEWAPMQFTPDWAMQGRNAMR